MHDRNKIALFCGIDVLRVVPSLRILVTENSVEFGVYRLTRYDIFIHYRQTKRSFTEPVFNEFPPLKHTMFITRYPRVGLSWPRDQLRVFDWYYLIHLEILLFLKSLNRINALTDKICTQRKLCHMVKRRLFERDSYGEMPSLYLWSYWRVPDCC